MKSALTDFIDDFFKVSDVHGRELLNLFHSLDISHLMIRKEVTIPELESFVETKCLIQNKLCI